MSNVSNPRPTGVSSQLPEASRYLSSWTHRSSAHGPHLESGLWHTLLVLLCENIPSVLHILSFLGTSASILSVVLPAYLPELA